MHTRTVHCIYARTNVRVCTVYYPNCRWIVVYIQLTIVAAAELLLIISEEADIIADISNHTYIHTLKEFLWTHLVYFQQILVLTCICWQQLLGRWAKERWSMRSGCWMHTLFCMYVAGTLQNVAGLVPLTSRSPTQPAIKHPRRACLRSQGICTHRGRSGEKWQPAGGNGRQEAAAEVARFNESWKQTCKRRSNEC